MKKNLFALLFVSASAFAGINEWSESYSQGTSEYTNTVNGITLLLSCPEQGNGFGDYGISLKDAKGNNFKSFTVSLNETVFNGPDEASNDASESNLKLLFKDIRKYDAIVKVSGKTITFPKAKVNIIPNPDSRKFNCQAF